jgi:hypothetical protein
MNVAGMQFLWKGSSRGLLGGKSSLSPPPRFLPPPRIDQRGGEPSRDFPPTRLGSLVLPPQLTDPKPPGDSDPHRDSPRLAAVAGGEVN